MASAVVTTITYSVNPAKQAEYDRVIREVAERINARQSACRLTVYRSDDGSNSVIELYECESPEAYDNLEDTLDDETNDAIQRIASEFATARQSVTTLKKIA